MRSTITVSLPQSVRHELDRVSRMEGVSRSDVVRESVRDYLFQKQFRALRKQMIPKAVKHGVYNDQDVFDVVS